MGEISLTFEITALAVLVAIIIVDLLLVIKRPHVPSMKECVAWVGFYVSLALIFAVVLYVVDDTHHASVEFLTGWLTEYSLSVDNLFVFILIMGRFAVPRKYQQEVLMVGIIIALIARAIFIMIGAVAIEHLSWIFYIFGLFLLYTAWTQVKEDDHSDEEEGESRIQRIVGRFLPFHSEYDGNKLRTVVDGKRMFTPMLMVFIVIGLTDVMFAIDSIPAIFGITQNPFIVFTANLFALMGLRQLYFLLGGLVDRLVYLHYGIAAILAFIGVKLIIHAIHEAPLEWIPGFHVLERIPEVNTFVSLGVIVGSMVIATVASLLWGPKNGEGEIQGEPATSRASTAPRVEDTRED
ncbi:TerC/Alx family metal homeostasis membrane protein [Brachybacterium sp. JHP9]|uniref:TerC/Alx family metal homeostasis membrane protein n=1 Tax=Brachybacterium equifaecis TaxID=2910770 RepID=A0ABT0R2R8_9MICO|nr:TerC/Alx family metal homeostasis membrane protein [Brachybacterium equifaecis]MCL6424212.1 TerC/Alx family metal homeostasis membrane protein [Brachybacterium equifaecis]